MNDFAVRNTLRNTAGGCLSFAALQEAARLRQEMVTHTFATHPNHERFPHYEGLTHRLNLLREEGFTVNIEPFTADTVRVTVRLH